MAGSFRINLSGQVMSFGEGYVSVHEVTKETAAGSLPQYDVYTPLPHSIP